MPITPPSKPRSAEAFISAAPDAGAKTADATKRTMKGKQAQISHAMPPELLDDLDSFAERNNLKRAQAINIAIRQMLEQGLVLNLTPVDREGQS